MRRSSRCSTPSGKSSSRFPERVQGSRTSASAHRAHCLSRPCAGHRTAREPITTSGVHRGVDDVGRQTIDGRPRGTTVCIIRGEARRFDRPVIFSFQGTDDCGKRDASAQRFSPRLVCIREQHREHKAACSARTRENRRLGRHAGIVARCSNRWHVHDATGNASSVRVIRYIR